MDEKNSMVTVMDRTGGMTLSTAATREERIRYYHEISAKMAAASALYAVACGIELIRAKSEVRHGKFMEFVRERCGFGQRTAQKYMKVAGFALGGNAEALALGGLSDEAILGQIQTLDRKTVTDVYQEAGIVKPSATQGGRREGAGRPRKEHDLAAELRELEESPAENLAVANELFGRLTKWGVEEGGLAKLPAKALPQVLACLRGLEAEVLRLIGGNGDR